MLGVAVFARRMKLLHTHDLVCPGLAVGTLDKWVNPEHFSNIALENFRLVGGDEGLNSISLVEEDVESKGER